MCHKCGKEGHFARGCAAGYRRSQQEAERQQLYNLLLAYAYVFPSSDADLGDTGELKHAIDTGTNPPICQAPRRVPLFHREEVCNHLHGICWNETSFNHPQALGPHPSSLCEKGWFLMVSH